jgi:hypothetical protein
MVHYANASRRPRQMNPAASRQFKPAWAKLDNLA